MKEDDKDMKKEMIPRHVPENYICGLGADNLSGKEASEIIEEIMVALIKRKTTISTAKQLLNSVLEAIENETIIGDRNVRGEIVRAGR